MKTPPPLDEIIATQAAMLATLEAERETRLGKLPQRALLWLALAPAWTADLAKAADFPHDDLPPVETLERIAQLGLCRRDSAGPRLSDGTRARGPTFWMGARSREGELARIARSDDSSRVGGAIEDELSKAATAVLRTSEAGTALPLQIARWATLAQDAGDPDALAARLSRAVEEHLGAGTTADATRWVEAARVLEVALGQTFTPAVERAARRIELYHRRRDDARRLEHFFPRADQVQAFEQLMKGPRHLWALHYVGSGGVGKSMLVRHIAARMAPAAPWNAICAQVDFDYLSPDYPLRSPGLLLAAFAEELRLQDERGVTIKQFDAFDQEVGDLHQRTAAALTEAPTAQRALQRVELGGLVSKFAAALKPLERNIVLLLDTCEELAKTRPDGTLPESVQVTFDILTRVQKKLPDRVRVVFCGRRPLASQGAGWRRAGPVEVENSRPYLRLHEIVGFSCPEAEQFVSETLGVPAKLAGAVVERSGADTEDERFEPVPHPNVTFETPAPEKRFNPFELALYGELATHQRNITVDQILARDTDPYVELRIARRVAPSLVPLVIGAALAGQFDRDLMRAISTLDESAFAVAFEELTDMTWVSRNGFRYYEVDTTLRPRLERHYQGSEELPDIRRRLLKQLERITLEYPLASLDRSSFDSALRLLRSDPQRAARWWEAVERRLVRERAFDWAFDVSGDLLARDAAATEDLASIDAAARPVEHPLRAAILATYAGSCLHHKPGADRGPFWAEVERKRERHPDQAAQSSLRMRAIAGAVSASRFSERVPDRAHVDRLWELVEAPEAIVEAGESAVAAVICALEAVLEHAELSLDAQAQPPLGPFLELARTLDARMPGALAAFATALAGRAAVLLDQGDREQGRESGVAKHEIPLFERAIEQADAAEPDGRWLDWRAPEDLCARLRLELARSGLPPRTVLDAIGSFVPRDTSDGRRLTAALLSLRAAMRPVGRGELSELILGHVGDEPECNAHAAFEPLVAVVAGEEAATGCVEDAVERLRRARRAAEKAGLARSARAADHQLLRIARRMRLRDERGALPALQTGVELEDQALAWALEALDRLHPATSTPPDARLGGSPAAGRDWPAWRHARWRSRAILDARRAEQDLRWASWALAHERHAASSAPAAAACLLDAHEANLVAGEWDMPAPCPHVTALPWSDVVAVGRPHDAFRLTLRARALGLESHVPAPDPESIGIRLAAEIAFDEGELLALRLPKQGVAMLHQSQQWYDDCGDRVGALLVTTCEGLARVRLRETGASYIFHREVYEAVRLGVDGLPPWEQLEPLRYRSISPDQVPSIVDAAPAEWRPWLLRLLFCLNSAGTGDDDDSALHTIVGRAVRAHFGDPRVPPAEGLPRRAPAKRARPRLVRAGGRTPAAVPAEYAAWPPAGRAPLLRRSVPTGWLLLLAVIVALLALGVSLDVTLGIPWWLPAPVAFLGLGALGWAFALIEDTPRGSAWAFGFGAAPVTAGDAVRVSGGVRLKTSRFWRGRSMGLDGTIALGQPAGEAARMIAIEPLARVRRRSRLLDFSISVDTDVAWVPWEAIFAFQRRHLRGPGDVPFAFRREGRARSSSRTRERKPSIQSLTSDVSQDSMARLAWGEMRGATGCSHAIERLADLDLGQVDVEKTILHLVGTPVRTYSGLRFSGPPGPPQAGDPAEPGRRDAGLASGEITSRFRGLDVCVVQGLPPETSVRTDEDREQAARLRAFGAEISEWGVRLVLVLPSLPLTVASEALAMATGPLWLPAKHRQTLPAALAAARTVIAAGSPGNHTDQLEAGFDACLYDNEWGGTRKLYSSSDTTHAPESRKP